MANITDSVDELTDETKRLRNELLFTEKLLNVLIEFKAFVDLNSVKFKLNLDENDLQKYEELEQKVAQVFGKCDGIVGQTKELYYSSEETSKIFDERVGLQKITSWNTTDFGPESKVMCRPKIVRKVLKPKTTINDTEECLNSIASNARERRKRRVKPVVNKTIADPKTLVCDYPGCEYRTPNPHRLRDHKDIHRNDNTAHKCPQCEQTFATKSKLRGHIELVHQKDAFVCDICDKRFTYNSSLSLHKRYKHLKKKMNFVCTYPGCGYRCLKLVRLTDHKDTHRQDCRHQCSQCDKAFTTRHRLKGHIERVHQKRDEKFVCDICDKQMKSSQSLYKHKKFNHLEDKRFVCTHENVDFKTALKPTFLAHIRGHSTDRPFKCRIEGCDKTFKTQSYLDYHIKCHTTERNFVCPHEGCGKTFVTSVNMRNHVKHNHSDVSYRCDWPGCEYSARRKETLKRHSAVHSDRCTVDCIWPNCDKRFKTRNSMNEHLKIHKGDKRHACVWPGCQYRCITAGNLKHHMRVHQKN